MLFCILRGNALIAKYVDKGSMVSLVAAPIKRRTIAFTQMTVLVSGILLLVIYSTIVELICAVSGFPGEYAFFLPAFFPTPNTALPLEPVYRPLCMYCRCLQMSAEMRKTQSISHFSPCLIRTALSPAKAVRPPAYLCFLRALLSCTCWEFCCLKEKIYIFR